LKAMNGCRDEKAQASLDGVSAIFTSESQSISQKDVTYNSQMIAKNHHTDYSS